MGIFASTVSICHFRVQGELSNLFFNILADAHTLFAANRFINIDEGVEELSTGWVHLDDPKSSDFPDASVCRRDRYLIFSLRRDQRKIPAALLKEHLEKACDVFLAENPSFTRVPKKKKEELKEQVRLVLMAKTLPDPKIYDVVWDTENNLLTFTTLSAKTIEVFEDLFKRTFEGLRLVAVIPYERAMDCVSPNYKLLLKASNRAGGESFIETIQANKWIGEDFMFWLLYQTMKGSSEYKVTRPGPMLVDAPFVAYINDKVVLSGESENGPQMITVNGPQDHFHEVKAALKEAKRIAEATIHLETDSGNWSLTLKGELFHFASFSSPDVRVEKDSTSNELMEREAVFYDRMGLLDKGLQLFESLFAGFLKVRLTGEWMAQMEDINHWLGGE
jgi:hypothetical protein